MIPLFVGYALIVWVAAARYRREAIGFGAVVAGLLGLLVLNWLHGRLNDWSGGTIHLPVLRSIMYPYTALVTGVGAFIAALPRRSFFGCVRCGYELEGLEDTRGVVLCPECGEANQMPGAYRLSGLDRDDLGGSDRPVWRSTPQVQEPPGDEDHERKAGDQAPSDEQERAL